MTIRGERTPPYNLSEPDTRFPEFAKGMTMLAVELREDHIPDFSNGKNHDPFESAFADLHCDLRVQA